MIWIVLLGRLGSGFCGRGEFWVLFIQNSLSIGMGVRYQLKTKKTDAMKSPLKHHLLNAYRLLYRPQFFYRCIQDILDFGSPL